MEELARPGAKICKTSRDILFLAVERTLVWVLQKNLKKNATNMCFGFWLEAQQQSTESFPVHPTKDLKGACINLFFFSFLQPWMDKWRWKWGIGVLHADAASHEMEKLAAECVLTGQHRFRYVHMTTRPILLNQSAHVFQEATFLFLCETTVSSFSDARVTQTMNLTS